jgi:predicted amidophosphoribosyltransferase
MNFIKKCPKCGFIADDKSQFCRSCGNPLKIKSSLEDTSNRGGTKETLEHISEDLKKVTSTVSKVESALNTASKIGSATDQISKFIVRPPAEWRVVVGEMLPVAGQQIAEATISAASRQIQMKVTEEITKKLEDKQEDPLSKMIPNVGTPATVPPMPEKSGEYCPVCNNPVKPNAKFCKGCGSPLSQPEPSPQISTETLNSTLCLVCRSPLTPGAKFCYSCGTKVGSTSPSTQMESTAITCKSCGSPLKEGAKFCKFCGAKT